MMTQTLRLKLYSLIIICTLVPLITTYFIKHYVDQEFAKSLFTHVMSSKTRKQTNAEREALKKVIASNNAFSFDLYEILSLQEGNLIVSPLSAEAALAFTMQGAVGSTANQISTALHLPSEPEIVLMGFKIIMESFNEVSEHVKIKIANKLYTKFGAEVKPEFRKVAEDVFKAEVEVLDFQKELEVSRQIINHWVEEKTDNKIKDLLDVLDPYTYIVLVNAIYFKADWASPFSHTSTQPETFHVTPTEKVDVPMMHKTSEYYFAKNTKLDAKVLEIPYVGEKIKMLIILPNDVHGIVHLERKIRNSGISNIRQELKDQRVIVSLPKFKMESKFELHKRLPELGIVDIFEDNANLTGIADIQLKVDQVIQKVYIETAEEGTVAAVATGVAVPHLRSALPNSGSHPETFKADHPFVFLILDINENILFMGRINKPTL